MGTDSKSGDENQHGCCGILCLQCTLALFNFIFLLSGAGLLVMGIWTLLNRHSFVSVLSTHMYSAATVILIVAGILVIFCTIIGCIGGWKKMRNALTGYTLFLLIIFLLEIISGIMAYVYASTLETELVKDLNTTLVNYYHFDVTRTGSVDDLQRTFKCCGAKSFEDWRYSEWIKMNLTQNLAPDTCCRTYTEGCGRRDHPSNIYYQGCVPSLAMYFKDHLVKVGAVALSVCVLEILGMVLSCVLIKKIDKAKNDYLPTARDGF